MDNTFWANSTTAPSLLPANAWFQPNRNSWNPHTVCPRSLGHKNEKMDNTFWANSTTAPSLLLANAWFRPNKNSWNPIYNSIFISLTLHSGSSVFVTLLWMNNKSYRWDDWLCYMIMTFFCMSKLFVYCTHTEYLHILISALGKPQKRSTFFSRPATKIL